MTDRWTSIAAAGTPFLVKRVRSQFALSARMFAPASGSRNVRWCPDRRRCSPSGISSARAKANGCDRDRMVSDANRSGC
jgi:hypothetical protein